MNEVIGRHVGGLSSLREFVREETGVVQAFSGNPRSLSFKPIEMEVPEDVTAILHLPFVMSCCRHTGDSLYRASMYYLLRVSEYASNVGIKYLVTHLGGPGTSATPKQNLKMFLSQWLYYVSVRDYTVTLCLENDVGSSKGRDIGSVEVLSKAVRYFNSPNLKMCLDTEHAWAYGEDINRSLLEKNRDVIGVVHLNSIPQMVKRGSHLDRHSDVVLEESTAEKVEDLIDIANYCYDEKIPCVLERDARIVERDLEYLKGRIWKQI